MATLLALAVTSLSALEHYHVDGLVSILNEYREIAGSRPLQVTDELVPLCRYNNYEMLVRKESGHWMSMTDRWRWLRQNGVDYQYIGEIAGYFPGDIPTATAIFKAFEASDSHRQAIINPRYTHVSYSMMTDDGDAAITIVFIERW